MQFTYTIEIDDDYTPWGEPEIIAAVTADIASGLSAPYVVTVRAVGPIDAAQECTGCVVETTDTGTFESLAAIKDDHLRETARDLAAIIEGEYVDLLFAKRDEINAMIQQMGGC